MIILLLQCQCHLDKTGVEVTTETMYSIAYTYFLENCGLLDDSSLSMIMKCKTCHQCKNLALRLYKCQTRRLVRSNMLRNVYVLKYNLILIAGNADVLSSKNNDIQIQKNFWGYIKTNLKQSMSPSPTFDCSACTQFYATFSRSIFLLESFRIPDWIPSLA